MPRLLALVATALIAAASARADESWQYRIDGGGEFNVDPHLIFDLGFRKGPWSLELQTDTLDLRWAPKRSWGRAWLGVRGEALAAGLMTSPWAHGGPDPGSYLFASYAGIDGGAQFYLGPVYLGVAASERVYFFSGRSSTTIAVPGTTSVFTADFIVGRWTKDAQIEGRAGLDLEGTRAEPHAFLFAAFHPTMAFGPIAELRAGWAQDQSIITRTRLGGLTPYVVPLAGAAWAEFRVERFVAARLGLEARTRYLDVGALIDAAAFDEGVIATGFALRVRGKLRRYFLECTVGWAPWIERQPGIVPLSAFLLGGVGWGDVHGR